VKIVSDLILKENKQLHETKSLKEEIKGLKDENNTMMDNITMARIFLNKPGETKYK
jgi:cell division protein FtsB